MITCHWFCVWSKLTKKGERVMKNYCFIICVLLAVPNLLLSHEIVRPTDPTVIRLGAELYRSAHKKDINQLKNALRTVVNRYKKSPEKFAQTMKVGDDDGWGVLFHAVEIGEIERIKLVLDALQEVLISNPGLLMSVVNAEDVHGRSPLFIAAERRSNKVVPILLRRVEGWLKNNKRLFFEFINAKERHIGWSPLLVATHDSASIVVDELIKSAEKMFGKNSPYYEEFVNARGSFGRSPVVQSIDPRDRWLLIEHGARDDSESGDPQTQDLLRLGKVMLDLASVEGNEKELKNLFETIRKKYPQNYKAFLFILTSRDEAAWTPLMNAAAAGNPEYIHEILTSAAEFFKSDTSRLGSPGAKELKQDDKEWASLILNNADVHGRTPLHLVISRRYVNALRELLAVQKEIFGNSVKDFNRFVNLRTELNGFTALLLAAYTSSDDQRSFDIISSLVERAREVFGVDSIDFERFINARDLDDQTPLAYIVSPRIRAYLRKYGAK